jgi:CBS domain-containing protein
MDTVALMNLRELLGEAPFVCGPETSLIEVAAAMERSDLEAAAVVEGLQLMGLVTESDLRRAVASDIDLGATSVADVMSRDPDTFDADLDVWDAAAWITESGYRHLPVVDDDGTLQGVVSVRDLLKGLVDTV